MYQTHHAAQTQTQTRTQIQPRSSSVAVVAPAAVRFAVIVVVRAVAAIAANEEQCPTVFLVEESRCDALRKFPFHSLLPRHRMLLLVAHSFCRTLSLASGSSQTYFLLRYFLLGVHFVASISHFYSSRDLNHAHVSMYNRSHHTSSTYVITLLSRPRTNRQ